ncbi:MAG: thioesterase family protein [Anaerolineales bacterium]
MSSFNFRYPIEVRYADIDSFRHVNNARYFTYMEQARARYLEHVGLWDGQTLDRLEIILASIRCDYKRPIAFGDQVIVAVATIRLGRKSFDMRYAIEDEQGNLFADGQATLVAYDYRSGSSIELPPAWRQQLAEFEGLSPAVPE